MEIEKTSEILKALGHPVRLQIVIGLSKGQECNVNKMVSNLNLPQSTVSQHLAVLKSRGVIACKKHGVETCYFVADEKIKKILDCLE